MSVAKRVELQAKKDAISPDLDALYAEWEELEALVAS